ncbi:TetR/AcrR family transcriptional regulator [Streptomyces sp. 4F14]|uniref:TetR/AcrR family transcriptional regulator n=1 Tax=Streptomyces sp. 4F14 TaxID=3394380 RepID=UPI003A8403FA
MATTKSSGTPPVDRRVRRTRTTLERALIDLVGEQRDLAQISVADVADRAEVSRSTFYDHYKDVHELAEAASTSMIDDMIGFVLDLDPTRTGASDEDPDPALTAFFAHFAQHAGLYRSLLGPTGSARVIEHVRRRTTATAYHSAHLAPADGVEPDPSDLPHDVPAAFVAGALLGVATDWLLRGCPRPPAEMTRLTKPLLTALADGSSGR